jgi:hypothetical protein
MYTISQLARELFADGWASRPLPYVQFRRRGEVLCGRPVDAFDAADGTEVFQIATTIGRFYAAGRNVMLCGGVDGKCTCASEGVRVCSDTASVPQAAAGAALTRPPLGNTGGTVSRGQPA